MAVGDRKHASEVLVLEAPKTHLLRGEWVVTSSLHLLETNHALDYVTALMKNGKMVPRSHCFGGIPGYKKQTGFLIPRLLRNLVSVSVY